MKYSTWFTWFITSIMLFITVLIIMTFPNTKEVKELPYILGVVFINFIIAVCYGFTPDEDNTS